MFKKALSIMLTVIMVFTILSSIPITASAATYSVYAASGYGGYVTAHLSKV